MQQWSARSSTYMHYLKNSASASVYTVNELRDPNDTFYTPTTDNDNPYFIVSQGVFLTFYINAASAGVTIIPQDTASISIMGQHCAPTTEGFTAPESVSFRPIPLA